MREPHAHVATARLGAIPNDVVEQLRSAVNAGDREAAFASVNEVSKTDASLADELRQLIKAYRFDEVLEVLTEDSRS